MNIDESNVLIDLKGKGKVKEVVVEVEEEEQLLQMSNERFSVPEVLFNPSTIGLSLPLLLIFFSSTRFESDSSSLTN